MAKARGGVRETLNFLVNEHPIASRRLKGRRLLRFAVGLIPLEHAERIHDDRILVVGDAAGMVDPVWGGGICYAVKGGALAAEVAVKALEENLFDGETLSTFEKEWRKGEAYRHLRKLHLILKILRFYSKIDGNAYFKLHRLLILKGGGYRLERMP